MTPFKLCMCCNTPARSLRQRVCKQCKAPAIWREATCEEIEARADENRKLNETLESLLRAP